MRKLIFRLLVAVAAVLTVLSIFGSINQSI